jgi:6,7-dimethyl-8-ribityllumazine synthase
MSTADAPSPEIPRLDPPPTLLIVRAPYYRDIVEGLTQGAVAALEEAGARYDVVDVAGAYELAQAIRLALRGNRPYDGFIALGCVVRGETDHYTFICDAAMNGLMHLSLTYGIALGTGLLTVDTLEQARARARPGEPNKGTEAAVAALKQIAAGRFFGALP